jgi:methylenetetrahydrofolate dehydrogenase (NADP+)/methenyltetrahydrofolate cyclohydrolase
MIINGTKIAQEIEGEIWEAISKLEGRPPSLAFIRVGEDPASIAYINQKKRKCQEVGIHSIDHVLPKSTSQDTLMELVALLNKDEAVDGILIQLPLPKQLNPQLILTAIDPNKDIDGFHPVNMGKLLSGEISGFFSCTPFGIATLLERLGIEIGGQHVVIVGRSNIVGKPLAALLVQKRQGANATVTIAHSATPNLHKLTKQADILVAAIGKANYIRGDMVKPGATVIDVGINQDNGKLIGDVCFDEVKEVAANLTPVPGGVGPMTIAMLLFNTLEAYKRLLLS